MEIQPSRQRLPDRFGPLSPRIPPTPEGLERWPVPQQLLPLQSGKNLEFSVFHAFTSFLRYFSNSSVLQLTKCPGAISRNVGCSME